MDDKMQKKSLIALAMVFLSSCSNSAEASGLTFKAGNDAFHLTQTCVKEIALKDAPSSTLDLTISQNVNCSERLNKVLTENMNKDMIVMFRNRTVLTTRISSSIKTENGFALAMPDRKTAKDVCEHYKR